MTKIPAGASLLFGALNDCGRIKQRKIGGYKVILKGVDQINWFTDRPERVEGTWKPRQFWGNQIPILLIEDQMPSWIKDDDDKEIVALEMFQPQMMKRNIMLDSMWISCSGEANW